MTGLSQPKKSPGAVRSAKSRAKHLAHSVETEHLAAIVNNSDIPIISKDLEGTILSWNRAAERLYGYTAEEAIGQNITMLIPSDKWDDFPAIMKALQRGELIEYFPTERRTKEGRLLPVALNISPIRDNKDEVIGASVIVHDLTKVSRQDVVGLRTDVRDLIAKTELEPKKTRRTFLAALALATAFVAAPTWWQYNTNRQLKNIASNIEDTVLFDGCIASLGRWRGAVYFWSADRHVSQVHNQKFTEAYPTPPPRVMEDDCLQQYEQVKATVPQP